MANRGFVGVLQKIILFLTSQITHQQVINPASPSLYVWHPFLIIHISQAKFMSFANHFPYHWFTFVFSYFYFAWQKRISSNEKTQKLSLIYLFQIAMATNTKDISRVRAHGAGCCCCRSTNRHACRARRERERDPPRLIRGAQPPHHASSEVTMQRVDSWSTPSNVKTDKPLDFPPLPPPPPPHIIFPFTTVKALLNLQSKMTYNPVALSSK